MSVQAAISLFDDRLFSKAPIPSGVRGMRIKNISRPEKGNVYPSACACSRGVRETNATNKT